MCGVEIEKASELPRWLRMGERAEVSSFSPSHFLFCPPPALVRPRSSTYIIMFAARQVVGAVQRRAFSATARDVSFCSCSCSMA